MTAATHEAVSQANRRDDQRPRGPLIWDDAADLGSALPRHAMIDIETLGTKPGAVILSIGAVIFGPAGIGAPFYAPVKIQSCTEVGLDIDPSTLSWWMGQSDEARAAAFQPDAAPLRHVLLAFNDWFVAHGARYFWCHGAAFDAPLLEAAFKACGLVPPWKFHDVRDTRTLYDLAGVKPDRNKGTHHNALDDTMNQADAAVKAFDILAERARRGADGVQLPADLVQSSGQPGQPTLRLGQIAERLGFNLTAECLSRLGFAPAGRDRAAVLYHERDFPSMCAALIRHVTVVAKSNTPGAKA